MKTILTTTNKSYEVLLKVISLFFVIPMIISGIICGFFILIGKEESIEYDIPVTAYISYLDRVEMDAYVNYEYDGKHYEKILINYYSSNMQIEDEIKIHISSEYPEEATVKSISFLLGAGVFIFFGIVTGAFFILHILAFLIKIRRKRLIAFYNDTDIVDLTICSLIDDTYNLVNGEYQKFIVCKLPLPNEKETTIKSRESFPNLNDFMIGNKIRVYLNFNNLDASTFVIDSISNYN